MRRIAALLSVSMLMVSLMSGISSAGELCVYVLGEIGGQTVTTPGIIVVVPDSGMTVEEVHVHVDEQNHTILGYSVSAPALDASSGEHTLYVPGTQAEIGSLSATVPNVSVSEGICTVIPGVTTPAVPIYVPESVINTPEAWANTPTVSLNVLGNPLTVPGQILTVEGRTIIIPAVDTEVPSQTVETPDMTLTVDINGTLNTALYLLPE